MALTKLKGTSWYQAKDPVDDYIDRFQELIDLVEYDDDKTIVINSNVDLTQHSKIKLHCLEMALQTSEIWRDGMKLLRGYFRTRKETGPS